MQAIAEHFSDQTDVWIEVWNEPFHWDNQNNYSHELWLTSMEDMVKMKRIGIKTFFIYLFHRIRKSVKKRHLYPSLAHTECM